MRTTVYLPVAHGLYAMEPNFGRHLGRRIGGGEAALVFWKNMDFKEKGRVRR